jgi:hypothetical protein
MRTPTGEPLHADARATCTDCGARTWLYKQPNGTTVALTDQPGPYVLRNSVAYLTGTDGGYARHSDFCTRTLSATLIANPTWDEFLWA